MKRMIVALSLLLIACSQGTSSTSSPVVITTNPQETLLPTEVAEEVTSIPATLVPLNEQPAIAALPSGSVTMVALGDSLTQGDGDDTGRG